MRIFLILLAVGLLIGAVVLFGGGFTPGNTRLADGSSDAPSLAANTPNNSPTDSPAEQRTPLASERPPSPTEAPSLPPVTGVVIDPTGAPIAGAHLTTGDPEHPEPAESAADGTFSLSPPSAAPFWVHASAPGHVATSLREVRAGARITVVLDHGVAVTGKVVDAATGAGIPAATARLATPHSDGGPGAVTHDDGRFEIVLPDPTHALSVWKDGYDGTTLYAVEPRELGDDWTIRLAASVEEFAVYYRVLDSRTGRAVSDVAIGPGRVVPLGEGLYSASTRTTFLGRSATVTAPGHVDTRVWFHPPLGDAPESALEVLLPPDVTATGRLLDARGEPIGGARLEFERTHAPEEDPHRSLYGRDVSDEAGRFRVSGLLRNAEYSLEVRHEAFATTRFEGLNSPDAATWDVGDLVADDGASITGRVVREEDDLPIVGATLTILGRNARSDIDGRFSLSRLTLPGELRVRAQGRAPAIQDVTSRGDVLVRLASGHSIDGIVRGPGGVPAAGAWVETGTHFLDDDELSADALRVRKQHVAATTTDAAGRFRFDALPPGRFRLSTGRRELEGTSQPVVQAGATDVELELAPPTGVVGRVVSALDGAPVTRFKVAERGSASTHTDGAGRFFAKAKPGESLTLTAWAEGFSRTEIADLILTPGEVRELVFPLSPESSVEGVVWAEDGTPFPDVEVRIVPAKGSSGMGRTRSISDTRGRFRIGELAAGEYRAVARTMGQSSVPLRIEAETISLAIGQQSRIDLRTTLPAGPNVIGVVRLPQDARRSHTSLTLTSESISGRAGRYSAKLDADGRFEIGAIAPGSYRAGVDLVINRSMSMFLTAEPSLIQIPDTATFECTLTGDYAVGED